MKIVSKYLVFISIFGLFGCGDNSKISKDIEQKNAERIEREWIEKSKESDERELMLSDAEKVRSEMTKCKENRDKILSSLHIFLADKKYNEAAEYSQKCLYWLNDDKEFTSATNIALVKLAEINLLNINIGNHEERLHAIRGLLSIDSKLKPKYASELSKLERIEKAAEIKIKNAEIQREKAVAAEKRKQGVHIGMTQEDVVASQWGRPRQVNRTTTINGVREQWIYGNGYLYFDDGILTAIQN